MKKTKKQKEKSYPAHILAVVLVAIIFMEAIIIGSTSPEAWKAGSQVLDLSSALNQVMNDTSVVVDPLMVQYQDIKKFYEIAAAEMIVLFDASDSDPLLFPRSVLRFYELASIEMERMLDFSEDVAYWPRVAGVSISK
jgi:hypothetical protein